MICSVCPRGCKARRAALDGSGVCAQGAVPRVAKAMLHMWEEPCVSGSRGSGVVFFSGCPLGCVYCQNHKISRGDFGIPKSAADLRRIYFDLIDKGAHNINLVTPTHFAPAIIESLRGGLPVPVVYNTSGYESVKTLRLLDGLVQIYLTDMKYALRKPAAKYSSAPDYPEAARLAALEMLRQTGSYVLDSDGILQSGVIIRHLVLPDNLPNTYAVIDWVSSAFSRGEALFSLMSQYTPAGDIAACPELGRRLTEAEYGMARKYLEDSGIEDGFYQELSSAKEEYVPEFDLSGLGGV